MTGEYKLTRNPDAIIRTSDGACISKGSSDWRKFEAWLDDGNSPLPAETDDEIKLRKSHETDSLMNQKIAVIMPESKIVKLIRKEAKGNASQNDIDNLDAVDAVKDASDLIKDQIETNSNYDHIDSPLWP